MIGKISGINNMMLEDWCNLLIMFIVVVELGFNVFNIVGSLMFVVFGGAGIGMDRKEYFG